VREPLTFIEKSDSALQFSRRIRPGYMQVVEHPDGRQSDELRSGYKKIGRVVGIVEATGDAKPALQCGFLRGGSLSASWKIDSTRPKLQLPAHPRHHNTMFAQSFRASVCCSPSRLGVKLTPLPPRARRLHASLGSNLSPWLAAPSSRLRPSAQVTQPNCAAAVSTDPIRAPADLVQDLYLRELKNYKVPQLQANDAEGHVQKFKVPAAPTSPEEADIASDLKTYETQTVDIEGGASEDGTVLPEEDWFEEEDESITTAGATH
jgi:F-type H+-transporting ATPase subunit h